MIFSTFLYYIFFSSSVLMLGIGIDKISETSFFNNKSLIFFLKVLFTIFLSSVLSWVTTQYILLPIKLQELFPITTFFIFACISAFVESVVRITTKKSTTEFVVSFLIVMLAVSESSSIIFSLIISVSCFISMCFTIPFINTFKKNILVKEKYKKNYFTILFLFLAVLIMIISVFDVAWLSQEVLQW